VRASASGQGSIGFLKHEERLNVALTRARYANIAIPILTFHNSGADLMVCVIDWACSCLVMSLRLYEVPSYGNRLLIMQKYSSQH
jgi:hypothetical protein